MRLQLESDQNVFKIGSANVRTNGRFTRRWTPRRAKVGAPIIVKRSRAIRIRN